MDALHYVCVDIHSDHSTLQMTYHTTAKWTLSTTCVLMYPQYIGKISELGVSPPATFSSKSRNS